MNLVMLQTRRNKSRYDDVFSKAKDSYKIPQGDREESEKSKEYDKGERVGKNTNIQQEDEKTSNSSDRYIDTEQQPDSKLPKKIKPRILGKTKKILIQLEVPEKEYEHWQNETSSRNTTIGEEVIGYLRARFPWN